ncbi:hypothetical protein D3C71_1247450 [compost metagenome]
MAQGQNAQADRCAVMVEAADKAQASARVLRLLPERLQRGIQQRQLRQRGVDRQRGERARHQRRHLHLLGAQRDAAGTRQDQQFAAHILAGQVHARVRLGVTGGDRLGHPVGERTLAVVMMEQPGQRAGQHPFDPMDAVATGDQRAQAAQQRQPGSDRGAVAVARRTAVAAVGDRLRARQVRAPAELVGGDHVHPARQPLFVPVGNLVAGGRINHHIAALQAFGLGPGVRRHCAARGQVGLRQFMRRGLCAGACGT